MTSVQPLPVAPDTLALTADAIAELCAREAGMRILVHDEHLVTAETPVLGMPHVQRAVICQFDPNSGQWRAGYCFRHGTSCYELVRRRTKFADIVDFGVWLGGMQSIPAGSVETVAIQSRSVA